MQKKGSSVDPIQPDGSQGDREAILAAVNKNGLELQYASDALKADREVALAAVKQNSNALQYASDALKADRDFVIDCLKDSLVLVKKSQNYFTDKQIDDIFIYAVSRTILPRKFHFSPAIRVMENVNGDLIFVKIALWKRLFEYLFPQLAEHLKVPMITITKYTIEIESVTRSIVLNITSSNDRPFILPVIASHLIKAPQANHPNNQACETEISKKLIKINKRDYQP